MTLRIVSAQAHDLERYIDLLEEVADWLLQRGINQWRPGSFRLSSRFYADSIARGEVQLAFSSQELVGTLRLLLREPIVWPDIAKDDAVYVYNLAVRRQWANQHLGRRLLEWAGQRASVLGRRCVRLDCMADNNFLRSYYTQAGFVDRGEVDAEFPAPIGRLRLQRYEREVQTGGLREVPLKGGLVTKSVVRVGDTVRRSVTARSPFVHELLRHLERVGSTNAPRFIGIDQAGRETLSFVPGFVPSQLGHFSDAELTSAARLLRQLHDATADSSLRDGHEVVCHGDASPCNCVFVDGLPAAFIDFDNAHPGSRLDDVAYAAWLWVDIGNHDLNPEGQGRRLADFFRSYGLDPVEAVGAIVRAQEGLAGRPAPPGVREWAIKCRAWVERNRAALSSAILAR